MTGRSVFSSERFGLRLVKQCMEGQWFLYPSPDCMVSHSFGFLLVWPTLPLTCSFVQCIGCTGCIYTNLMVPGQTPHFHSVLLLWIHISSVSVLSVKGHLGSNRQWHCNHFPCRSIQPVCSTGLITAATHSFPAFSLHQLQLPLASPLSKMGHSLSSLGNRIHMISPLFHTPWPLPKKPAMPNVRALLPISRRMPADWLQLSALLLWS